MSRTRPIAALWWMGAIVVLDVVALFTLTARLITTSDWLLLVAMVALCASTGWLYGELVKETSP